LPEWLWLDTFSKAAVYQVTGIRVVSLNQQAAPGLSTQIWPPVTAVFPGLLLSSVVAGAAVSAGKLLDSIFPVPAMVIALLVGIALNRLAQRPIFQPGISFCLTTMLRVAVALLGLRIAVGDIAELGIGTAALVILSMIATIAAGFLLARFFGQPATYGALAGAATAVCGASATLATAAVLPDYRNKSAEIAFVCVAVNALSTIAMLLFPLLCSWIGFDERVSGVMLGATIHDVAQVAGAGYALSEPAGNTAVVVKLFRVFMLLPVVVCIGWWFARSYVSEVTVKVQVPAFAIAFLVLCGINSLAIYFPAAASLYAPAKSLLIDVSTWGLLIAISALGLATSFSGLTDLGWRHVATMVGTTTVILAVVCAGLLILR
jgi:uncharacterized integral membrane protein (TIGR00698 family)